MRLGLRARLLMLVLVPSLVAGLFVFERARDKRAAAREAGDLALLVRLAVTIGDLVHETQKERGSSSVFMSSEGTKFANELAAQRRATDDRRLKYLQFVKRNDGSWPSAVAAALRMTDALLSDIEARRRQASDLSVPVPEIIGYYNELNRRLLESVASIVSKSADADLRAWSTAYFAFLHAKENTGMERAQLSNVFGSNRFAPGQFFTVASLIATQRTYLHVFDVTAPGPVAQLYREKAQQPAFAEVEAKEQLAFTEAPGGGPRTGFGVDSPVWFKLMTRKIDLMKEVETATAEAILARASEMEAAAAAAFEHTLAFGVALLLGALACGLFIAERIVAPIRLLAKAAEKICAGDLDHTIPPNAPAEVGDLALSFRRMVDALRTMHISQRKNVPGRVAGSRPVLRL